MGVPRRPADAAIIGWLPGGRTDPLRVEHAREAAEAFGEDAGSMALTALRHAFDCGGGSAWLVSIGDGSIPLAHDVALPLTQADREAITRRGINVLARFPGRGGVLVWGGRTLASVSTPQPEWRYVNVRRLFLVTRRLSPSTRPGRCRAQNRMVTRALPLPGVTCADTRSVGCR